jgi:hypothetical protein
MALLNIICDSCRRRVRVPEEFAGKRVTCPKCEQPVYVPATAGEAAQEYSRNTGNTSEENDEEIYEYPDQLGMVSLTLASASVLMLCIPFVSYLVIAVSAAGVIIGLAGLPRVGFRGPEPPSSSMRNPVASNPLVHLGVSLSFLGTLASLFVFSLELLPHILRVLHH